MIKKKISCQRCAWVPVGNTLYENYHDQEWGIPVHDDRVHYEFLLLEGAQAGLSWETILKRREHYAKAFAQYDWNKVAKFDEKKKEELLQNPGIIRNRLKIASAINNAQKFQAICKEFGSFDAYVWCFVNHKPIINRPNSLKEIPAKTKESIALSKDLIKRGFNFVGPVVIYAYMQAVGLVNDHTTDCFLTSQVT